MSLLPATWAIDSEDKVLERRCQRKRTNCLSLRRSARKLSRSLGIINYLTKCIAALHWKQILGCVPSNCCHQPSLGSPVCYISTERKTMERKSEYTFDLSWQAKERCEVKFVSACLRTDPNAIENWNEVHKEVLDMRWSIHPNPIYLRRDKHKKMKNTSV